MVAAVIPAALYLLYVYHYAVNVPFIDDWSTVPIVAAAIHGHIELGALWAQWTDSREVTGRLVYMAFGIFDHLNERGVILFSALTFTATYVLVLVLFRSYIGRRLTPLPVFVIGIVWFSLVDFSNALWAFQLSWYFTVTFTVSAIYLLINHRRFSFVIALVAALAASLSFIQGFAVWPIGLICLLWQSKRNKMEVATWTILGVVTAIVYFHGYRLLNYGCAANQDGCSIVYTLTHLNQLVGYDVMLAGNVIPLSTTGIESHLWVHGVQGAAIFLTSAFVMVQTYRERRAQSNPLPLLLIVFALLVDFIIAMGRFGEGLRYAVAVTNSRYTMPNLLLLVAIVIYVWAHLPKLHMADGLRLIGCAALIALFVVQGVAGTMEGLSQSFSERQEAAARIVVNLDRVPPSEKPCYVDYAVSSGWSKFVLPWIELARREHLSVFQPESKRRYRAEGLPLLSSSEERLRSLTACNKR